MLSLDWNLLFTVVNLVIFYILMKKLSGTRCWVPWINGSP